MPQGHYDDIVYPKPKWRPWFQARSTFTARQANILLFLGVTGTTLGLYNLWCNL